MYESFSLLTERLPFSQPDSDDLIVTLLSQTFEFDLSRVEYCLFNMVGLVEPNPDQELKADEKQKFYEAARAPVKKLQAKYVEIRAKLSVMGSESSESQVKRQELDLVKNEISIAMQNASRDIFERVNSKVAQKTVRIKGKDVCCVDLHGLHVNEAREIVREYILPILGVVRQIMVITGRGIHSETGKSVLRDPVRQLFEAFKHRCEEVKGNAGAFFVFY